MQTFRTGIVFSIISSLINSLIFNKATGAKSKPGLGKILKRWNSFYVKLIFQFIAKQSFFL